MVRRRRAKDDHACIARVEPDQLFSTKRFTAGACTSDADEPLFIQCRTSPLLIGYG